MSCAAVGLICVSVLGTAPLPPLHYPLSTSPSLLPLPLLYLFQSACLTHFSFRSFFLLLHTRKNQEKKGLIMVTSKLVVRLSPTHTPFPLPPWQLLLDKDENKKWKSGWFPLRCSASCCCCWSFWAAAFAVDFPLYLYTNFLFALLFPLSFFLFSTHFLCVVCFFFFIRAQFSVLRMRPTPSPFPSLPLYSWTLHKILLL